MSEKLVVFMTPPYKTIYRAAFNAIAGSFLILVLVVVSATAAAAKDSSEIGWTLKQGSLLQGAKYNDMSTKKAPPALPRTSITSSLTNSI